MALLCIQPTQAKPDEADTEIAPGQAIGAIAAQLETTRSPDDRALLLSRQIVADTVLSRYTDAENALTEARRLKTSVPVSAEIDFAEAALREKTQRTATAADLVRKTLDVRRKMYGPESTEAIEAEMFLTQLLTSLSKLEEAASLGEHSWQVAREALPENNRLRVKIGLQYARTLNFMRRNQESESLIRELVAVLPELSAADPLQSRLPNQLGSELLLQGRNSEAIPWLRTAVETGRPLPGLSNADKANIVGNLGIALLNLDRPRDALPFFEEAAKRFGEDKVVPSQASALLSAGTAADRSGDRPRGLELREQGAALIATLPEQHPLTYALNRFKIAQSYAHAGRLEQAEATAAEAATAIAKLRPPTHFQATNSRISLGWIKARRGRVVEGLAEVRDAFRTSIAANNSLEVSKNRVVGVIDNIEAYSHALETAVLARDNDFAFEVLQVLVETDASRAAVAVTAREQAGNSDLGLLLRRRQEAAGNLADADAALLRATGQEDTVQRAPLEQAVTDARNALAALDTELDTKAPGFRSLLRPRPVTLAETQSRLAREETLLVIEESDLGLYTMAITGNRVAVGHAPIRREALRALVRRIRAGTESGTLLPFDVDAAHQIYDAIFTPEIAALIPRKQRLRVVTGDILSALPLTLLASRAGKTVADTRWLVEDHALSVLPSLAALRQAPLRATASRRLVAIGAPALSGTQDVAAGPDFYAGGISRSTRVARLHPLPGAAREIAAVANRSPQALVLQGTSATEPAVRKLDYSGVNVVLFATHGLVAGAFDAQSEPALVLTPPQAESPDDDGLLTASEAARLQLDADWVILSACDTAAGDQPSAAGYTGLARAFLFAGARRVVASHWPVRDDVAARLSVTLLDASRKGASADEALRRAILKVMNDRNLPDARNPALWAPFMLVAR
ncbi:CHAT domain-containing protein [Novosphingobium sp. SL115]|uniref:CHAT domain-containing protein n=1 Tax=Novosphingobium sp. SL115 TaxID=2995150 RepID=UPI00227563B3|nr:CHAT domain-containing tetratricopeptide repeat protein [Novosphingobium sp. SL115]MCY1671168.1 CHAT domain-containing protein [Novosphingobium sp. SL115]